MAWGELFHSHFVRYTLTFVIVHSPFIATEERFFHFSICSHQKQIMLWEPVGGRTCPRRSPLLAGRGHYCLTFLLEFSIPAVLSSADCQLCLPSCLPLCHQCSCSLLSFSQGEHQRPKGPSVSIPKQELFWWSTGGPAAHPVLATDMKPQSPVHSHIRSKQPSCPWYLWIYHHKTSQ